MNPRLAIPFYLGLGAPAERRRYADCQVRAAAGSDAELMRTLLLIYRGESAAGKRRAINHRCAEIVLPAGRPAQDSEGSFGVPEGRFFFKEFPWHHRFHDLERWLRLSRVDRAWRAAYLLPGLGINTPRAVGTATARASNGRPIEYLATEWLEDARPFPEVVHAATNKEERLTLVCEFARHLRLWHDQGVYLRDLVKNVLVTAGGVERTFWLTDLDGLHPAKGVGRGRVIRHMQQLAHHVGALTAAEADAVCASYADRRDEEMAEALKVPP